MTSFRKTALVGGILYLVTFVGSIASALLVGPALNDPAYILGPGSTGDQQIGGAVRSCCHGAGILAQVTKTCREWIGSTTR